MLCSGSSRCARYWYFVPVASLSSPALTRLGAGVDLDPALISACSVSAASLSHAHLLNFFVADILDLDTLAAAHDFAAPGCALVIAMYLQHCSCVKTAPSRVRRCSCLQVPAARGTAQAPPPYSRQFPTPLPLLKRIFPCAAHWRAAMASSWGNRSVSQMGGSESAGTGSTRWLLCVHCSSSRCTHPAANHAFSIHPPLPYRSLQYCASSRYRVCYAMQR